MGEIMDNTSFAACLDFEKACQAGADDFYKQHFGNEITIFRPTWEDNKSLQQADIDVIIRWPELSSKGFSELKISEKFRRHEYDDILIEIYENIDNPKESWGLQTAADIHTYFWQSDGKLHVRMIPSRAIRKVGRMCQILFTEKFKDMHENNNNFEDVDFGGNTIYLILPPTRVNGKIAYRNACACVPKEVFEKFHFNIEELCN